MVKVPSTGAVGRGAAFALVLTLPLACKPEFSERSSLVRDLRVLAIKGAPAEAAPRAATPPVQYSALVVDSTGPRDDLALDWAYCTEPKPVSELNDVSPACFAREASWIVKLTGAGVDATGALPTNGCRQFGPNPPLLNDGGALGRPADPDSTGGYYQPVRVLSDSGDIQAVGQTRLHCDLAGATSDILREYSFRYRNNANPSIDELVAVTDSEQTLTPDGPGVPALGVTAGRTVRFRLGWSRCDENVPCPPGSTDQCDEPDACTGAESYVLFELTTRQLVERRESMRVSWFATAGSFANDNTGRAAEEYPLVSTENDWTAPDFAGDVLLWTVLRDSRGGVSWNAYRLTVR
jgi:hypothetical protein